MRYELRGSIGSRRRTAIAPAQPPPLGHSLRHIDTDMWRPPRDPRWRRRCFPHRFRKSLIGSGDTVWVSRRQTPEASSVAGERRSVGGLQRHRGPARRELERRIGCDGPAVRPAASQCTCRGGNAAVRSGEPLWDAGDRPSCHNRAACRSPPMAN